MVESNRSGWTNTRYCWCRVFCIRGGCLGVLNHQQYQIRPQGYDPEEAPIPVYRACSAAPGTDQPRMTKQCFHRNHFVAVSEIHSWQVVFEYPLLLGGPPRYNHSRPFLVGLLWFPCGPTVESHIPISDLTQKRPWFHGKRSKIIIHQTADWPFCIFTVVSWSFMAAPPLCHSTSVFNSFGTQKKEMPLSEKAVSEKPVSEKAVSEKPVSEKCVFWHSPFAFNTSTAKPVREKPVSEKPVTENHVFENLFLKNLYSKKRVFEKPVSEKRLSKKPLSEKPVFKKTCIWKICFWKYCFWKNLNLKKLFLKNLYLKNKFLKNVLGWHSPIAFNTSTEKPLAEKPVSEKPVTEKPVSDNLYLKKLFLKNLYLKKLFQKNLRVCWVWVWAEGSRMKYLDPLWVNLFGKHYGENDSRPFIFQKEIFLKEIYLSDGFVGLGSGWRGLEWSTWSLSGWICLENTMGKRF